MTLHLLSMTVRVECPDGQEDDELGALVDELSPALEGWLSVVRDSIQAQYPIVTVSVTE